MTSIDSFRIVSDVNRILSTCVSVLVIWLVILQAEEFEATDLGNNWYEHAQFGTFYDANNSDWYYHLDHGWIYVDEWDDNGTWMYVPLADDNSTIETNSSLSQVIALGWVWSTERSYPTLYNDRTQGWMYAYGKGSFYDYRNKWKFDLGLRLKEIDASDANASRLESLRRFFDTDNSEVEPTLSLHSSAQLEIVNLSLSKEKLTDDSNWTKLIDLCRSEPDESYKRSIFKIEENENEFVIYASMSSLIVEENSPLTDEDVLDSNITLFRSALGKINHGNTAVVGGVNLTNVSHVGVVNLTNVSHGAENLSPAHFDNGPAGHIDSTIQLPNGTAAIKIRKQ